MVTTPELGSSPHDELVMTWRFTDPVCALSSATVGGGWGRINWIQNIAVDLHYARTDLDVHAAEVATAAGLSDAGATLFTAADIRRAQSSDDDDLRVDATVGITKPTWAADAEGTFTPWTPGTINIVVQLPVALEPAAAVNAIMTVTEAKTQALIEASIPGTGTASDAVVLCWPTSGAPETFGGPRSPWGSRLARASHRAVVAGIAAAGPR